MELAAEGLTDTAIALKLGISEATVGTYWGRVRIKLGPYSRTELVAIIMRAEQETALEALRKENERLVGELVSKEQSPDDGFYQTLLEHAPDAMILLDETGIVRNVNEAACAMFGYSKTEFEGMEVSEMVPARFRESHLRHRIDYLTEPSARQMGEHVDTPAVRKDGTEILIRAALSMVETSRGTIVICAVRKKTSVNDP